ncbi:hypothetical protein CN469_31755, partial [Bacillus cereus]
MMKNRAKKVIRKTVVGFALLAGIVMAEGNPASAEEHSFLKDSNGNAVEYGKEYYMEPYGHPGIRIEILNGDGLPAGLGTTGKAIRFQQPDFQLSTLQKYALDSVKMEINFRENFFGYMSLSSEYPSNTTLWMEQFNSVNGGDTR